MIGPPAESARHAARHAGDVEVVLRRVEGDLHPSTYAEVEQRARPVAQALARLGGEVGDQVGTLPWDGCTPGQLPVRGHWVVDC